ncbi:MAG: hypothetical protein R3C62_05150 [Chloroflexota bacterium]
MIAKSAIIRKRRVALNLWKGKTAVFPHTRTPHTPLCPRSA